MAPEHDESEKLTTKITAKLFAPMYADFHRQLTAAFLYRDAFLDQMIAGEIEHLRNDLAGKKLSPAAHRYISRCLKKMGDKSLLLQPVSIVVAKETAAALRSVVEDHNLVRDAFLNWLIALLRSSDKLLDWLDLPTSVNQRNFHGLLTQDMPTSPMRAIAEIQGDPLYYLREACQARHGCGLYALCPPKLMHGFCCYLPDDDVPDTPANKEKRLHEEAFLRDNLDTFESTALAIADAPQGADHA